MGSAGMMRAMRSMHQDASVLKQQVKPGTMRRMLRVARPYGGLLALFLVVVVAGAGIDVARPLIYRAIIDSGILAGDVPLIERLAVLLVGLGIVDAGLGLAQTALAATVGARVVLSLRSQLFDHIQQMPLAFFTRTQTGALISRLDGDVGGARTAFTDILSNGIGNGITIVLILTAMFALSWRISLAALVLLPLFILPARSWGRKLQAIAREAFDLHAAMNSIMVERFNVAGAQLAKLFGRPRAEHDAFAAKAERVAAIGVKRAVYGRLLFTALAAVAAFATALAYGWGGVLAARHVLDVGTVVALATYLVRLYAPLIGISNIQVSVMTALVSFDRVFELLDLRPAIQEKPGAWAMPRGPASIAFENVSFRYPGAEVTLPSLEVGPARGPAAAPAGEVLHGVGFTVPAGTMTALVGPSGAGKTTITQLIPRLYDPLAGAVLLDGHDVRAVTLDSLRGRIGVVTQDAHLFHDTLRANLLYAKPTATDGELWAALEAACIRPLVASLRDALDTLVGERGYRFSGGEKQRLAIARLLLKSPDLVILDEATAHLDSAAEAAIQQAFVTALAGRTSIVIAHRLSTILRADQILVVAAGRIVQRGRHADLVAQPGLYQELYSRQFAEAASSVPGA